MTTSTLVIISYHPDLGHRHNDHWWLDSAPCALRSHPQHTCKILFHSPLISSGSLDHSWIRLILQSFHPWDYCHSQFVNKFSFSHCKYTGKTSHFRLNELTKRAYVISLMSFWIEFLFQVPQLPQVSLSLLNVFPFFELICDELHKLLFDERIDYTGFNKKDQYRLYKATIY